MKAEARRQFIHFVFGSMIIALVALKGVQLSLQILMVLFLAGLAVSYAIKKGLKIPGLMSVLKRVERDYEKHLPGKGALLFFAGAIMAMVLFGQNQNIVLGALGVAVFGDAASTIVGITVGKHRLVGKKTLEGTIGGILASFFFLSFLFQWQIALAASLFGMLAELIPIDDNFTIPLATGAVLTILLPLL